ncbi:hypothetical protein [Kineococcus terrestris]|uniref:hypothetical protein n=1 Tax=Kineococcus terrestris TaxID=2044856 RepID=UPI0034DB0E1A
MPETLPRRRHRAATALADLTNDEHHRAAALGELLPAGAALARRTAAHRHGFRLRMPHERTTDLPVECVVPTGRDPVRRSGVRSWTAALPGEDVELLDGLPTTTALRTCLDVARWETPPLGLAMLDRALRVGLLDPEAALQQLERQAGERFVARARRLLLLCDAGAESPGESWLRLRLADAGFPPPVTQVLVPRRRRAPLRLDLGWPDRGVGVEYDGREHHEGAAAVAHDAARREELLALGWTVVGVHAGHVLGRSTELERGVGELLGLEPVLRRTW